MFAGVAQAVRPRRLARLCGLLLPLCLVMPAPAAAGGIEVVVVLSDATEPYQAFVSALRQSVPGDASITVLDRAEEFSDSRRADLILTVGVKAADQVASRAGRPVLAAMLPSGRYAELAARRPPGAQLSAIFVDQPWSRHVGLLNAALPGSKRIGLLHSTASGIDLRGLRGLMAVQGATLNARAADPAVNLFDELENVLSGSDALLAAPDSAIYNSRTIRNILLTSYRHRVPLIGLSQAYVNAGALCAVFSTPEQLAAQAGATVASFAQIRQLPPARFPDFFTVAVNREVARMLGIVIGPDEALKSRLEEEAGRGSLRASRMNVPAASGVSYEP